MRRFLKFLLPVLILLVLGAVVVLLHHELRRYDYAAVSASLRDIPWPRIAHALGLTALSYALLVGYDALALRQIGRSPGLWRTAFVSFTAYVLSYNIGLAVISGTAVRFRLYSAWGYTAREIAQVVTFTGATFWLGLFAAAGALLAFGAPVSLPDSAVSEHLRPVGWLLLALGVSYVVLSAWRREPIVVRGWTVPLPRWPRALGQLALGATDVIVAGLVAWSVMPVGWPLSHFLGVYILGMTLGLVSHVPGGLGVLETIVLYGRPDAVSGPAVLSALLVYRVVYYLIPLGGAVSLLAGHEIHRHRERLQSATAAAGRWMPRIAPHVFAAMVFLAGVILLVSSATPSVHGRLAVLQRFLPLPLLEVSHLLSSVVGLLLLLLARGLQRRLDGAYVLTVALLAAGAILSLLKGGDWEEAVVLGLMLAFLLPSRGYFQRPSSLLEARFTPGWITAIAVVIAATIWLGFFAYRHVEYRHELWWHFAFRGDAPRFLRAAVAVVVVAAAVGLRRLLRPAAGRTTPPDDATLERASVVAAASPDAGAHLALVGDKALLFSESGRSFIMYGVESRSWIAMGDPVGDPQEFEELVWSFRELTDQNGGWTAFYEVGPDQLPLYLDLGLTLTKLGEEARVPLAGFQLERLPSKSLRRTLPQLEAGGADFEWLPAAAVPALLPELRAISASWLDQRPGEEKGFSLGFFDEAYLRRTPIALVRQAGRVVAFANIWGGAQQAELSVDLMRYAADAPPRVMDYLLLKLMQRGAADGYQWFNLGMAPLSGMDTHALAPLPRRIAARVFTHGERFYHFQGLRAFKEKFGPVWRPRYLASPGGLALPLVLANVTRLIARGPAQLATR
jgi:phosphatidylglycerol lysyltransferase